MQKQTTNGNRPTVYDVVTNRILAELENGVTPWRKPWNFRGYEDPRPRNFVTGYPYRGVNLLLGLVAPTPFFMTFRQIKEKGGAVRKGASAWPITFFTWIFLDANGRKVKSEKQAAEKRPCFRYYSAFNSQDIVGIDFPQPEQAPPSNATHIPAAAAVLARSGARVVNDDDNRAFYHPSKDFVNVPHISRFNEAGEYYCTAFHELTHWTGHPLRLDRFKINDPADRFGTESYSKEELIAEIGAAFLCAEVGIDSQSLTKNSAAYLQGWISALKGDSRLIVSAAAHAQKAVDLILGEK